MSIQQKQKNGNMFLSEFSEKLLIAVLFISIGLLAFSLGRISAFDEINPEKTPVQILNAKHI